MKGDYIKIAKTLWEIVGKDATAKYTIKRIQWYVHELCRKYNMRQEYEDSIVQSFSDLATYTVRAKLSRENIDSELVLTHIKGPIAQSLIVGVTSVNGSDNLIAELLGKIDELDFENVESVLSNIGMTDTSRYLMTLREILHHIKVGTAVESNVSSKESDDIPYAEEYVVDGEPQESPQSSTSFSVRDNMSDDEDEQFVQNLPKRFFNKSLSTPQDAIDFINTFRETTEDVMKFTELQKTKRAEIRAATKVRLKEIDAMRDVIMEYLDKTFDERSRIFSKEFEWVDRALDEGNTELLALHLGHITELAKSSPFKALADIGNVKKQLTNKDAVFDI